MVPSGTRAINDHTSSDIDKGLNRHCRSFTVIRFLQYRCYSRIVYSFLFPVILSVCLFIKLLLMKLLGR